MARGEVATTLARRPAWRRAAAWLALFGLVVQAFLAGPLAVADGAAPASDLALVLCHGAATDPASPAPADLPSHAPAHLGCILCQCAASVAVLAASPPAALPAERASPRSPSGDKTPAARPHALAYLSRAPPTLT
jgi:hypothetical protein